VRFKEVQEETSRCGRDNAALEMRWAKLREMEGYEELFTVQFLSQ